MRPAPAILVCALTGLLHADERTQKLVSRLSEEADAFRRIAPQVLSEETLHQRALKPPPRFRPRIGTSAKEPPKPTWQQREIVSEYAFATFSNEKDANEKAANKKGAKEKDSAEAAVIHELRQVVSADG